MSTEGQKLYMYHKTPGGVSQKEFGENWDRIYGKKVAVSYSGIFFTAEPTGDHKQKAAYFIWRNTGRNDQLANYYAGEKQLRDNAEKRPLIATEIVKEVQEIVPEAKQEEVTKPEPEVVTKTATIVKAPTPLRTSKEIADEKVEKMFGLDKSKSQTKNDFLKELNETGNIDRKKAAKEINGKFEHLAPEQTREKAWEEGRAEREKINEIVSNALKNPRKKESTMRPEDTVAILEKINKEREEGKFKKAETKPAKRYNGLSEIVQEGEIKYPTKEVEEKGNSKWVDVTNKLFEKAAPAEKTTEDKTADRTAEENAEEAKKREVQSILLRQLQDIVKQKESADKYNEKWFNAELAAEEARAAAQKVEIDRKVAEAKEEGRKEVTKALDEATKRANDAEGKFEDAEGKKKKAEEEAETARKRLKKSRIMNWVLGTTAAIIAVVGAVAGLRGCNENRNISEYDNRTPITTGTPKPSQADGTPVPTLTPRPFQTAETKKYDEFPYKEVKKGNVFSAYGPSVIVGDLLSIDEDSKTGQIMILKEGEDLINKEAENGGAIIYGYNPEDLRGVVDLQVKLMREKGGNGPSDPPNKVLILDKELKIIEIR